MTGRERAWRVLAHELSDSTVEQRGTGERAAGYLLSPLGARINRVLLAGLLGPAESVGRDPAQPFWKARLSDPTGAVSVTAGSFQPHALAALQEFREPSGALICGKVSRFEGRDGARSISVRAEELRRAGPGEVRDVQLEAVRLTLDRIELVDRIRQEPGVSDASLRSAGYPSLPIAFARDAVRSYPGSDPRTYLPALAAALGGSPELPGTDRPRAPAPSAHPSQPPARAGSAVGRSRSGLDREHEAILLDLLDELSEHSDDGCADLRDAERLAAGRGLTVHRLEEVLGRLEEDGVVEEPVVGRLRRA